ncbi:UNVERIFIED_CONTAM: hypothetical protein FKN15_062839 [Acipenser sinensis]
MKKPQTQGRLEVLQVYKLLQCVRKEDRAQIEKMVGLGVPNLINATEPNGGESALHLASVANNIGMCSFLLSLGAHANVQDLGGCTPVMKAAELGHDNIVEVLTEAGADMTIVDNEGKEFSTSKKKVRLSATMKKPQTQGRLEVLQVYKLLQCVRKEDRAQIEKMVGLGVPNLINATEPNGGESALHLASVANNIGMCSFLLSLGAHANVQDLCGCTPVMKAAELGHDNIVEALTEAGADMTIVDNEGKGILFYCIYPSKRHLRCAQIALKHGADVNNCSLGGKPVFMVACEQAVNCSTMCLNILEREADPNATDESTGCTALMEATRAGAVELVRAILQRGGNINSLDKMRNHASHFAAEGGFFEKGKKVLFERWEAAADDDEANVSLMCQTLKCKYLSDTSIEVNVDCLLQVIRVLSAYNADLCVVNMQGNTPLHPAAKGGFADCCKFLAQRGCNPKIKNLEGSTASMVAKENGHKAVMKELRKAERLYAKYAKPGAKNPNDPWAITLYDWALEHEAELRSAFESAEETETDTVSKDNFVAVLQEKGAPVEQENIEKVVLAHDKSREGSINITEFFKGTKLLQKAFLMSSYAPKKKKGKKGKKGKKKGKFSIPMPICTVPQEMMFRRDDGGPPHFMIETYQHYTDSNRFDRDHPPGHPIEDDSAWYIDKPQSFYTNINYCVKTGDFDSLNLAFSQGVPVDVLDKFYKTPLMCACAHAKYDVAKYLISKGANVNACDQFKWTPLHHASHAGQQDIVELLVESGAEIDAAAINGATPLMRAIESCRPGCVEYLIKAGAKVQIQNKQEKNAMDTAKAYADFKIVDLVQAKFDTLPKPKEKKGKGKAPAKPKTAAKPKIWTNQPTTKDLIQKKEERRSRLSYESDFEDFMMPFKKNIMEKSFELGGPE